MTTTSLANDYKQITINGISIAYQEFGSPSAPPLVLLHGHISDLRTWSNIAPLLAADFHVFVYSRRFAWPNKPIGDEEGEDWEQHGQDLGAFIEALHLQPAHVLANSSGAYATVLLARKQPALLASMMLEEPPILSLFLPNDPPGLWDLAYLLWNHPFDFLTVLMFGATAMGPCVSASKARDYDKTLRIFGPAACGSAAWERWKTSEPERMRQAEDNKAWLGNFYRLSRLPPVTPEEAKTITTPALVLTGMATISVMKATNSVLASCLPGCHGGKPVIIPDATHLMHEDQPERVCQEVVAFVRELKN